MSRDREYDPYRAADGPYGAPPARAYDPYGAPSAGGSAQDPSASGDPYATGDPYPSGDPYAAGDPYATGPDGSDPYATDPLRADGFGPGFWSSPAPSDGVAHSEAPAGGQPGYGTADYGTPGYGIPGDGTPGYGTAGYGAARPSSGSAIAGFVLGLLAVAMCSGLTAPVGIFLSAKGLRETDRAATPPKDGRGLAIAGLVLSLVGLIPLLVLLAYILLIILAVGAETVG